MTIAIIGSMIFNFYLLYNRKKKWILSKYKWYVVLGMLLSAFIIIGISDLELLDGKEKLAIWGLMTPTVFSLLDYFLKSISKLIHNRDFHLWLKGSNEIDDSKLSGGKHVRASDRIFSMILMFAVMFLPLLIIVFIGK